MSVECKDLVRDAGASAIGLLAATKVLVGDFLTWEPESLWIELERQGIDIPTGNRAKLMAGMTLFLVPSFYWDAITFEKTALAFDGVMPVPDILEEARPSLMAWAVVEAAWIIKRANAATWEFGHEPRAYAGVVLHRAGFVLAPEELAFSQPVLNRERFHTTSLLEEVKARWASVDQSRLETLKLEETPVDVQIARLAAVALHVRERRARVERDLARVA